LADGTLEGDVSLEYTGHEAVSRKYEIEAESPEQRLERVRETVKSHMNTAEASEVKVENATDPEKPLIYRYHVRVPGYAQRTGKRLFLQMAYFQYNSQPLFTAAARKYPVHFNYPWSEEDYIEVQMPPGFELDHAEAPAALDFGEAGKYEVRISVSKTKKLLYSRQFKFGAGGFLQFKPEAYPQVKRAFDRIHEADEHTITLKQEVAAAK
jgi:hypothetical protein